MIIRRDEMRELPLSANLRRTGGVLAPAFFPGACALQRFTNILSHIDNRFRSIICRRSEYIHITIVSIGPTK
jgi:hypothetical protein